MLHTSQLRTKIFHTSLAGGLTLGLATSVLAFGAASAQAADSPVASSVETIAFSGSSFTGQVPNDTCSVTITAQGGAGGLNGVFSNPPGAIEGLSGTGALISASYAVRAGMVMTGEVGGSGALGIAQGTNAQPPAAGGTPDGGNSGEAHNHHGGGGGGSTSVTIDGTELIVAGGGGGYGGGHSLSNWGGDAGLPTVAGVAAGHDGGNGLDIKDDPSRVSGGGQGGQVDSPGAGGVFTAPTVEVPQADQDSVAGFPGSGRQGGKGGTDPSLDAGGGGGGGYYGAGGGASTLSNGSGPAVIDGVGGGGGGGGASYVSPDAPAGLGSVTGLSAVNGPEATRSAGSPNGFIQFEWFACGLVTNDGSTRGPVNEPQSWMPSPTNEGTGEAVSATALELLDANGDSVETVSVPGGTYSLDGDKIIFTPESDYTGHPSPVQYRVQDAAGNVATGTYTPVVVGLSDEKPDTLADTGFAGGLQFLMIGALTALGLGGTLLLRNRGKRDFSSQ